MFSDTMPEHGFVYKHEKVVSLSFKKKSTELFKSGLRNNCCL